MCKLFPGCDFTQSSVIPKLLRETEQSTFPSCRVSYNQSSFKQILGIPSPQSMAQRPLRCLCWLSTDPSSTPWSWHQAWLARCLIQLLSEKLLPQPDVDALKPREQILENKCVTVRKGGTLSWCCWQRFSHGLTRSIRKYVCTHTVHHACALSFFLSLFSLSSLSSGHFFLSLTNHILITTADFRRAEETLNLL